MKKLQCTLGGEGRRGEEKQGKGKKRKEKRREKFKKLPLVGLLLL